MLGTTPPALQKTEAAEDPRLSTIRRYVEGLGRCEDLPHDLYVVARVGDDEYRLRPPSKPPASPARPASNRHDTAEPTNDNERGLPGAPAVGGPRAWRLRAWDDPALEAAWHSDSVISIGGAEIGDLTNWPGQTVLRRQLIDALPDRGSQAIGMFVRYWDYFRNQMTEGDIVAVPQAHKRVGIARITGPYSYDPDQAEQRLRHRRPVTWLTTLDRASLDDDLRKVVNAPGTICQIQASDASKRLLEVANDSS